MARPKKKIQKREKVFNFVSKVIDLIQNKWRTTIKAFVFLFGVSVFIYIVFFWIDTVQGIRFEIIYI
jgi:maltodextrin utilization protein YvdJ